MLTQRFSHRSSSHGGAKENTTQKDLTSQGVKKMERKQNYNNPMFRGRFLNQGLNYSINKD